MKQSARRGVAFKLSASRAPYSRCERSLIVSPVLSHVTGQEFQLSPWTCSDVGGGHTRTGARTGTNGDLTGPGCVAAVRTDWGRWSARLTEGADERGDQSDDAGHGDGAAGQLGASEQHEPLGTDLDRVR